MARCGEPVAAKSFLWQDAGKIAGRSAACQGQTPDNPWWLACGKGLGDAATALGEGIAYLIGGIVYVVVAVAIFLLGLIIWIIKRMWEAA